MNIIKTIDQKTQWHLTTWLLICLLIYNVLDFETTYIALSQGMNEANPIIQWFLDISGTIWVILWVKLAVYAHIFGMYMFNEKYRISSQRLRMRWAFGACMVIYVVVVVSNFYKITNFTPV